MASFFDTFDALAIAFVLPALVATWCLTSTDVGYLIGIGFAGRLVGAIFFGWLKGRDFRQSFANWTSPHR